MDNNLINPLIDISDTEAFIASNIAKMRISEIRNSQHLTKKALAELSGLSEKSIAFIENPKGNPTFNSMQRYLNALGWEMVFKRKED